MRPRPDTEDFKAISAVIRRMDHTAESKFSIEDFFTYLELDEETVIYMAEQRAARAIMLTPGINEEMRLRGLWVEAFIAGITHEASRAKSRSLSFLRDDPGPKP